MNRKYWVYVHTCPNGKKYVGITTQKRPERRWSGGLGYKTQLFGKVVSKYGWDNITHEVFEVSSEEEMYYLERYLIAFYDTTNPKYGYNNSTGGEKGAVGVTRSLEYLRKQSLSHKGKSVSDYHRKRISEGIREYDKTHPEYRRHLSEGHKRTWSDESFKRKMSEIHKGKSLKKYQYLFPDGSTKILSPQHASRNYIRKGILLIKIEEGPSF